MVWKLFLKFFQAFLRISVLIQHSIKRWVLSKLFWLYLRRLQIKVCDAMGFMAFPISTIIGELIENSRMAKNKVLMAHLGNSASLCAAIDGKSIATTMGFSALDGWMMGTRSGSLDAGVLMLFGWAWLYPWSAARSAMRKLRNDPKPLAKEAIELLLFLQSHSSPRYISMEWFWRW